MKKQITYFSTLLIFILSSISGKSMVNNNNNDTITLGAGCFWCIEAVFQQIKGVNSVESGYVNGKVKNPTYREICSGLTGHAEVVQISYDANVVSFQSILEVFWGTHDPTTLNRQGADRGTQYRSGIFYHTEEQRQIAEALKTELNNKHVFDNPIVTEITPVGTFYKAENYHQDYFETNGSEPYCRIVIQPKLDKLKKVFADKLK
jgi:peptide-methionine (S)-S-oxide reductase